MAEVTEKQIIKLPSYKLIWKHDSRIYILFDKVLPSPVSLSGFGYFAFGIGIVFIVDRLLGSPDFMGNEFASFVVKYGFIPWLISRILKYNKLDGKTPVAFVRDYIIFFFTRGKRYEFFRDVTDVRKKDEQGYIFRWRCGYRHRLAPKRRDTA